MLDLQSTSVRFSIVDDLLDSRNGSFGGQTYDDAPIQLFDLYQKFESTLGITLLLEQGGTGSDTVNNPEVIFPVDNPSNIVARFIELIYKTGSYIVETADLTYQIRRRYVYIGQNHTTEERAEVRTLTLGDHSTPSISLSASNYHRFYTVNYNADESQLDATGFIDSTRSGANETLELSVPLTTSTNRISILGQILTQELIAAKVSFSSIRRLSIGSLCNFCVPSGNAFSVQTGRVDLRTQTRNSYEYELSCWSISDPNAVITPPDESFTYTLPVIIDGFTVRWPEDAISYTALFFDPSLVLTNENIRPDDIFLGPGNDYYVGVLRDGSTFVANILFPPYRVTDNTPVAGERLTALNGDARIFLRITISNNNEISQSEVVEYY